MLEKCLTQSLSKFIHLVNDVFLARYLIPIYVPANAIYYAIRDALKGLVWSHRNGYVYQN